jgi:uroporphyrin-3 C-methyltransferase
MNEPSPPEDKRQPEEEVLPGDDTRSEEPGESPAPEPDTSESVPDPETGRPVEDAVTASAAGVRAGKPPSGGGKALAGLALVLALAAAGVSGYVAWITKLTAGQADSAKADIEGEIGRLEARSNSLEQSLVELEREWRATSGQIDAVSGIEGRLEGRVAALESRTAALARTESVPRDVDWRLAEIEFLLRLANRQVSLARDPVGARAALENADLLLADLADPAMQPVRQQVADGLLGLRSLEQPDVEGLALRLGSLARRVESLPLASQPVGTEATAGTGTSDSGWGRLKSKIREFFASIFQVRRAAGSAAPLLSPEESFFLRRNLELELQAARVALLTSNAPVYRESLSSARRWAEEHFLIDDPGVQGFIEGLRDLEGRDITVSLPDLSGSLRAFDEARSESVP